MCAYMCMYVICTHTCTWHMCLHVWHVHHVLCKPVVCMCTCVWHVCIYVHTFVCPGSVCIYYLYLCVFVWYVCICACMYMCACLCVCESWNQKYCEFRYMLQQFSLDFAVFWQCLKQKLYCLRVINCTDHLTGFFLPLLVIHNINVQTLKEYFFNETNSYTAVFRYRCFLMVTVDF